MIQNIYDKKIDEIDEKVVNLPKRWNKNIKEDRKGQKIITK